MKCPDCGFENIDGIDECAECGASLSDFDDRGSEIEQSLASHAIGVLTMRELVCVAPETPVREVVAQMAGKKIGCVLVQDAKKQLAGVFSERDVLNKVAGDPARLARPVSEFMTPSPTTVTKSDSIGFALQTMDLGGYRHLPIINADGIPVGLLSMRDVLRFLCVRYAQSRS